MRHTFEFVKKNDDIYTYAYDARALVLDHIYYNYEHGYYDRSIEDRIIAVAEITGNLCDLLITKGLIRPEEVIQILGLERQFEVRESNNF